MGMKQTHEEETEAQKTISKNGVNSPGTQVNYETPIFREVKDYSSGLCGEPVFMTPQDPARVAGAKSRAAEGGRQTKSPCASPFSLLHKRDSHLGKALDCLRFFSLVL